MHTSLNSVSHMPGLSTVTLHCVPSRSALRFKENCSTNAFVPP